LVDGQIRLEPQSAASGKSPRRPEYLMSRLGIAQKPMLSIAAPVRQRSLPSRPLPAEHKASTAAPYGPTSHTVSQSPRDRDPLGAGDFKFLSRKSCRRPPKLRCMILPFRVQWEGLTMKQKPYVLKGQKIAPPSDAQLLRRMIELQKLRERVRLAEVAMKPRPDTSLAQHH
jgi:hypothetical protein